jgi:hypothetical protein
VLGIVTSGLLSLFSISAMQSGMSPLPGPVALVFAKTIFGAEDLPLVIGLLFHAGWVTFWTVVFVALFRTSPTFLKALGLGLGLWILVLLVFFPVVGWGLLGLRHGPALIVGSLVPHVLFAILLWAGCRILFPAPRPD